MDDTRQSELLYLDNVSAGYGILNVLKRISLSVQRGEAVALVGANGAGKTTTLKAIMGLLPISSGEVRFKEQRLNGMTSPKIAATGIAIVPEGREVFPSLTVEENLIVGSWTNQQRNLGAFYEEVYELFPRLKERRTQAAGTLSGGEQQMLALARALVSDPELLLVDEPSMGLAPLIVADVYDTLKRINQEGTAVLLVEQNVRLALDLCERAYVMERGSIVLQGSSNELKEDQRVIEAYLGIPEH